MGNRGYSVWYLAGESDLGQTEGGEGWSRVNLWV